LEKIFHSLDQGEKGYLDWLEFLNGMQIVFCEDLEYKVDLFLRMVDEDG